MLIVRSPVRISFAGGGTDLPAYYERFGGAVLSTAINKYFYSILRRRTDGIVQVISSDLRVMQRWEDIDAETLKGADLEIPLAVLKHLGESISVDLFLASEIPPGTGLGSSASVCVNILHALCAHLRLHKTKYQLAEEAFHIARNVLAKHVGKQDEYASAFGGLNLIEFDPDGSARVRPISIDDAVLRQLQQNLMLFFTGQAHHSWSILKEQEEATRAGQSLSVEPLHEIKQLAYKVADCLEQGDISSFGAILHEGWLAKRRVSNKISTSHIDELYELARANGAAGGKITGAGGGGFLLLYCEPQFQEAVRAAFGERGIYEMSFEFDFDGAKTLVNDPFIDKDATQAQHWSFVPVAPAESYISRGLSALFGD